MNALPTLRSKVMNVPRMSQKQKRCECIGEWVKDVHFEKGVDQIVHDNVVHETLEERVFSLQFKEYGGGLKGRKAKGLSVNLI